MGSYAYLPLERVVFGRPAAAAAAEEAARIGAQRVFVVSSKTLSRKTGEIDAIRKSLGEKYAGLFDECVAHTPWPSIIAAADAVRAAQPDLILTVGGGTPIDTVKIL
ncbi:MAG: iron-containing alcohol dehydrogenase, partial [Betaproteobacteria bacterium]